MNGKGIVLEAGCNKDKDNLVFLDSLCNSGNLCALCVFSPAGNICVLNK
jgi:hypothetical protein